jgi:hypothetical protein
MRTFTTVFLTLLTVAAFAAGSFLGYDYVQLRNRVESVEQVNKILAADYLQRKSGFEFTLPPANECPAP